MEYSATTDDGIAYPLCAYTGYRYRKPSYERRRVFALIDVLPHTFTRRYHIRCVEKHGEGVLTVGVVARIVVPCWPHVCINGGGFIRFKFHVLLDKIDALRPVPTKEILFVNGVVRDCNPLIVNLGVTSANAVEPDFAQIVEQRSDDKAFRRKGNVFIQTSKSRQFKINAQAVFQQTAPIRFMESV